MALLVLIPLSLLLGSGAHAQTKDVGAVASTFIVVGEYR